MNRTRTAIIIGGGIAGPATAMALAKAGIDATVYEARPGGADGGGVMLTLAVNGIDALRAFDAGAAAAAVAAGFPTPQITLRTHTGKRLGVTSTGGALADGTAARTTRRADLYQALHSQTVARGITVVGGKRLAGAEETPDGVRAVFADGTEARADILIGCDGVHSTVRGLIDPAAPAPSYAGLLNTGGFASGVTVAAPPGSYEMIFGKRAFFGYTTAPDGQVWWFVNLPQRREPARGEAEAISNAQWRQRLAEVYAEDAGPAMLPPMIMAVRARFTGLLLSCRWHLVAWRSSANTLGRRLGGAMTRKCALGWDLRALAERGNVHQSGIGR